MSDRDVGKWQRRLEENFSYGGVVGGRFLPIIETQEHASGDHFIQKFLGHRVLLDSFMDFFCSDLDTSRYTSPKTRVAATTSVVHDFYSFVHYAIPKPARS
ncbi:MAG: hypothetical protein ABSC26_03150 [Stellaceae bacterium]